jgi:hypothetical protein
MKIGASSVSFAASHSASMRSEVRETLRVWVGERPAAQRPEEGVVPSSVVDLSSAATSAAYTGRQAPEANAIEEARKAIENDPMLYLIRLVVEMMTGVKIKIVSAGEMKAVCAAELPPEPPPAHAEAAAPPPSPAGFGIEYDRHEVREEHEQTGFSAEGLIRTADGKEIRLAVTLEMRRSYRDELSVSLRAGDAVRKDPLVINFDGSAAQLQSGRFRFDLDGDGRTEDVPLLSGNRGYLAIDRNGNGKVDSGQELFGTASGDGFAELARYDSDRNGWIDDNDPVFADLRVWIQDDKGEGTLVSAKSRDVGALYLGRAATPFALKDEGNADLGAVRSTGLYLTESGSVGTLQQIDLMV